MKIGAIIKSEEFPQKHFRNNLTFIIFWEHEGLFYPSEDWDDFGLTIIGWWVGTIMRFIAGENEGEFCFMDGPYSILATYDQASEELELFPERTNIVWKIKLSAIIEALISTVNYIYNFLWDRNVADEELLWFKKCLQILNDSLLPLKK